MNRKFLIPLAIVAFAGLPSQARAGVILGSAESFAVLGGSTVTNTGPTTIFGDLGVWPGEAIVGFPPGIVTGGTIHAGDAIAQQAQSDLTTAYVALADMPFDEDLTDQDLGGLTLTPGVYQFSSLAQLTGELTLDGLGDPNALFVIQVGNELTTATNSSVNVINGGDSNVYWVIGSSATLGTDTEFAGSLLALTSITLNTGASIVNGRALARNGAVTLNNNNIAIPEPATVLLLGCGLAGLLAAGKKRRSSVAWVGSAGEPQRSLWSAHKTTPDDRRALHIRPVWPATKAVEKLHTKTDPPEARIQDDLRRRMKMSARKLHASNMKWLIAFLPVVSLVGYGCNCGGTQDTTAPRVTSADSDPSDGETGVAVDSNITAFFTEAMDPSTITTATFMVTRSNGTAVAGTIALTATGSIATFTPNNNLAPNSEYTVTITTGVKDAAGNPLANDFVWSFTTGSGTPIADNTAPTVSHTSPADEATGVAINKQIAVTFSESMNSSSIVAAFTVTGPGQNPIVGTVVYDAANKIATFTPAGNLATNTVYMGVLTTGARDLAGNHLAIDFEWSFTTGSTVDLTRPLVNSTNPGGGAAGVVINTKITATFTEAMNSVTINEASFTVVGPGVASVSGNASYAAVGNAATFTPSNNLAPNTLYTATLTTAIQDIAGNSLAADKVWTFRTASTSNGTDNTAPRVSSTNPADLATDVPINQRINATFSEAMDPLSISAAHYMVEGPGETSVIGTVSYDVPSNIATFVPLLELAPNSFFIVTITTGVKDLAGNALGSDHIWEFTTTDEPAGQASVDLQSAATFAILAGAGVTNVNNPGTIVNGDIGTSPTGSVDGFPPGVLNGTLHAADPIAELAKLDLTTAYNDAAGRALNVVTIADGELGGLTLAPGLYMSAPGSFAITSVDLTLDAQGDANAVYIFQMPSSTLTVGNGRQVILSGGAKAANIFWQVGTSATLGTTSVFKGTIMADQAITLQTGATLDGRILARIAAVSLDTNVITVPAP